MNTIIGLALLGAFLLVALFLGQILLSIILYIPIFVIGGIQIVYEKIKNKLKGGE